MCVCGEEGTIPWAAILDYIKEETEPIADIRPSAS